MNKINRISYLYFVKFYLLIKVLKIFDISRGEQIIIKQIFIEETLNSSE